MPITAFSANVRFELPWVTHSLRQVCGDDKQETTELLLCLGGGPPGGQAGQGGGTLENEEEGPLMTHVRGQSPSGDGEKTKRDRDTREAQ